ncbi:MAG: hypothetical protein M1833_006239 [Piccolia ochrophora]|nr:MAG: hypothetical protein M1833_006239 [Piccolia ochrophora]
MPAYVFVSGASLLIGLTVGTFFLPTVSPPSLAPPHTPLDVSRITRLTNTALNLPISQTLRAEGGWTEWPAYSNMTPEERAGRLSSGAMGGSRGLGVQHIFWNEAERKSVQVVWLGGALSGWPGVTHGGAIATVMDEALGRVAARVLPAQTGVTANLSLTYRSPTPTGSFYVLRAEPVREECGERKARVRATLETVDGKVCVEAAALFVVPKGVQLEKIDDRY